MVSKIDRQWPQREVAKLLVLLHSPVVARKRLAELLELVPVEPEAKEVIAKNKVVLVRLLETTAVPPKKET